MKPSIVISAINLRSGGTLSILQDCLFFLQTNCLDKYRVIALVHDKHLLKNVDGIEFIEFPKSIRSYFYRFYYEYVYFKTLSKQLKPYLWLSLHDMTPNVEADIRAVYCHNSSPFYKLGLKKMLIDPVFTLFNLFYTYIYRINIKKNNYVIVQQDWLRKQFQKLYGLKSVVVAYPIIQATNCQALVKRDDSLTYNFFFPTLPRFFKNIEVIIDAVKMINQAEHQIYSVTITVEGSENNYAKQLIKNAADIDNIKFIGRVSREEVFVLYEKSDCLIFPSKLETWGLPITEFKLFNKAMLIADLPYAHETVGDYEKVNFFDPDNAPVLADLMQQVMSGKHQFTGSKSSVCEQPFTKNWSELFNLILSNECLDSTP